MAINPPIMEMKMILGMVVQSISVIERTQEQLSTQHQNLTQQAEWIKEEIRKAMDAATPPTTDLDVLWERMKSHWQGDMGPAWIYVKDIKHIFKP